MAALIHERHLRVTLGRGRLLPDHYSTCPVKILLCSCIGVDAMPDQEQDEAPWSSPTPDEAAEKIADAGLLTERQALAYVLRDIECTPRSGVAQALDTSENSYDDIIAAARENVRKARETAEAIDKIRYRNLPRECADCGEMLDGLFVADDDNRPLCTDCAGVDRSEFRDAPGLEEFDADG